MAEINIEKKKNKPVWPWILGLLLLAGIIWAVVGTDSDSESNRVAVVEEPYAEERVATDPQSNVVENQSSDVEGFVSYVNETEVKDKMGVDHVVTSEAFIRLSNALEDLGQNDHSQEISEIRQTAQEIQTDPQSLQHANKVSEAFSKSANVLAQIQQNRFPETAEAEVEDVQEKARELEANQQLLNQKEEVSSFFEKAADAVEQMEEERTM